MALFDKSSGNPPTPGLKTSVALSFNRFSDPNLTGSNQAWAFHRLGIGLVVLLTAGVISIWQTGPASGFVVVAIAASVGVYMAMNIGANDVANNVGPAVGSKALTMASALAIAAVFEAAGALIAGGEVVNTISKGIVSPTSFSDTSVFVSAMLAALLAAALWVNIATMVGAPVSTTHSIVGGVMGGGIAAAGLSAVNWPVMGTIAASWMVSPVMGGVIAAGFLFFIKNAIIFREDKIAAAVRWIPVLVGIMAAAFSVYLATKGLKNVWAPDVLSLTLIGFCFFCAGYAAMRFVALRDTSEIENRRVAVGQMFHAPLIGAAALLSFAHGSNDVANAIGPLAAIFSAVGDGGIGNKVSVPFWILAIGAVFGVGFLREFVLHRRRKDRTQNVLIGGESRQADRLPPDRSTKRRKLVRRRHVLGIASAWIITVPASAFMSAALFFLIRAVM